MNSEVKLYEGIEDCCGCGACSNACSQNAIKMEQNIYGVTFPVIDYSKCINCKKCLSVCNFKLTNNKKQSKSYWIAINKDKDALKKSTSGGVFIELAKEIIRDNGIVYGCAWKNENGVLLPKHVRIEEPEMLFLLQGSKYVQSNTEGIYQKVKNDLKEGRRVLFSGTPCQIDGLYGFINNVKYDNLITVEVICHGVPSVGIFRDYIRMLENKSNGKIQLFNFRDKNNNRWSHCGTYYIKINGDTRHVKVFPNTSSYYHLFIMSVISRDCCYKCPYATKERTADFTLGDFWGVKKNELELLKDEVDIYDGVSCVIANSEKADLMIRDLDRILFLIESSFERVSEHNEHLTHPAPKNPNHDYVMKIYSDKGYEAVDKWFNIKIGKKKYIYYIWNKLPSWLKRTLKRKNNV